jgi:hypothetical protein
MIFEHFNKLILDEYLINIKYIECLESKHPQKYIETTSLYIDDLTTPEIKFLCKCLNPQRFSFEDLKKEYANELESLMKKGFIRSKSNYYKE